MSIYRIYILVLESRKKLLFTECDRDGVLRSIYCCIVKKKKKKNIWKLMHFFHITSFQAFFNANSVTWFSQRPQKLFCSIVNYVNMCFVQTFRSILFVVTSVTTIHIVLITWEPMSENTLERNPINVLLADTAARTCVILKSI